MAYENDKYSDEIHFYAASLDDPKDFSPQFHVHCSEQLPWIQLADDLPRHDHSAS